MKLYIILLFSVIGCASAKLSGTGINVHDPIHGFEAQANSINAEVNINADD